MKIRINDLSRLLGLSHTALIYYEKKHIVSPVRLENGYREYSGEDIIRLKKAIILRNYGFGIEEIERLLSSEATDYTDILQRQSEAICRKIRQILQNQIERTLYHEVGVFEILDAPPYFLTKEPCCNADHSLIEDSPAARRLICQMPFTDFVFFLEMEDVMRLDMGRIQAFMEVSYRGISLDSVTEEFDLRDLELCPARKGVHICLILSQFLLDPAMIAGCIFLS